MTDGAEYVNPRTNKAWPTETPLWRAPDDGGYVNLTAGSGLSPGDIDRDEASLWRYRQALRLPGPPLRSLGEGWTPLVDGTWDGMAVHMKSEFLMPSGSFKDRGTAVMLNHLAQCGVIDILEDSSGNAGASIATYGAALGLRARIFVPASAPAPKRYQMAAMGAEVVPVPGTRDDVARAVLDEVDERFYAGHNHQPFFLEGTKTLAFELWEQLGFKVPDNIVIPLGQGSNVMGCYIGFGELRARGEIAAIPRIFGIQAANAAPAYAAYATGRDQPVEIEIQPTIADGIASARIVRLPEVLDAMRASGGGCVAVSEAEIIAALRQFTHQGFFIEPTCAAAGAGLSKLIADGAVKPGDITVVILTGSGLKAGERIGEALGLATG
ncbi:MAG: threonine synthase [Alphaproteobacteria bacterium]|nr:threonine synthase [Alphaproteobacteria bacterium]